MELRDGESKYYYLYKQLKEEILSGKLKTDEKLPSKRTLAEHLGISLITVENAYQMLKDEGYIETRERSGYYVRAIRAIKREQSRERELRLLPTGRHGRENFAAEKTTALPNQATAGSLQIANFPTSLYFKTLRSVISEYGEELLYRSPNEGCEILRNSIAQYLLRYRGVFAQPEQIIIGSGAEHLYGSAMRLLGSERIYGIEDPSYAQIRKVYEGEGAVCEKLKMGRDGIESEALKNTKADVLHVTPFHSYPSGVTATIGKRYEYLDWAQSGIHSRYIIEDDFDSEFFMPGKPVETLFMLDNSQSVIYINTFSKSLSPSIRMGYMILPEHLLGRYRERLGAFSCTVPVLEQYTLAEFINKGYFEQHLNRVRRQREK
jgi:GntR family transcriptional regulator/MocR family aminotransferase